MNKKRIAIYGKGGIGKSTFSANLAVLLAQQGLKVFLIGCDPKQDTVRLIAGGYIPAILEKYEQIMEGSVQLSECVVEGRYGIRCTEVGGPKPGVGCAGRGLIMALGLLKEKQLLDDPDIIIYDVLGDVVCGGFATPIVKGYADEIYIVSSGEQASLYAANNITKGMNENRKTVKGLILNSAGFNGEEEIVRKFCENTNIPLISRIPRDEMIPLMELKGTTAVDNGCSEETLKAYSQAMDYILSDHDGIMNAPWERQEFYHLMEELYGLKDQTVK